MRNLENHLGLTFFGQLGLLAGVLASLSGCSSGDCGVSRDCFAAEDNASEGGQGGASEQERRVPEASTGMQGQGGAPPEEELCSPDAVDEPDSEFFDKNCDGIDGDVKAAIFVSPDGDDADVGSLEAPVASLSRAIELALLLGKDIYVCSHTYEEAVTISGDGLNIYGGFDCAQGWARTGSRAAIIAPSGPALSVSGVEGLVLEQLEFRGADASGSSKSSVGAIVVDSQGVQLRDLAVLAGRGLPGEDGKAAPAYQKTPPEMPPGKSCLGCSEGAPASYIYGENTCLDGSKTTPGGRGGKGQGGGSGPEAMPAGGLTPSGGGQGGSVSSDAQLRNGKAGPKGDDGRDGSVSVARAGSFLGLSYVGSNAGSPGEVGAHGGKGGGGAGGLRTQALVGPGGAQGGYGGCRGMPGTGGEGGGGSFALVVSNSEVKLSGGELVSGDAGSGGKGASGAPGQHGGKGGAATAHSGDINGYYAGGSGGDGGQGGRGGNGAPGGGGPSIPLALVSGEAPTVINVELSRGQPGAGGAGIGGETGLVGLSVPAYDFEAGTELPLE